MTVAIQRRLGGHAAAWDTLVDDGCRPSLYLRSWWLDAVAGADPWYLLVFDGTELIGGLALERDRRRGVERFCCIGTLFAADHLDLVAARGREAEVGQQLRSWIETRRQALFRFDGVDDDARLLDALDGIGCVEPLDSAPWGAIKEPFDDYWARRPSALRNTVRRTDQRLERAGVRHDVVPRREARRTAEEFERLHRLAWQRDSSLGLHLPRFMRAVHAGLVRGELVAHQLSVDGRPVALELWSELGRTAGFCQSGRDPTRTLRGVGSLLKARVVRSYYERGFDTIDLLRGADPYKYDWVDHTRQLVRFRATSGTVAQVLDGAARRARPALRRHRP